jgi:hypothetical protein
MNTENQDDALLFNTKTWPSGPGNRKGFFRKAKVWGKFRGVSYASMALNLSVFKSRCLQRAVLVTR